MKHPNIFFSSSNYPKPSSTSASQYRRAHHHQSPTSPPPPQPLHFAAPFNCFPSSRSSDSELAFAFIEHKLAFNSLTTFLHVSATVIASLSSISTGVYVGIAMGAVVLSILCITKSPSLRLYIYTHSSKEGARPLCQVRVGPTEQASSSLGGGRMQKLRGGSSWR